MEFTKVKAKSISVMITSIIYSYESSYFPQQSIYDIICILGTVQASVENKQKGFYWTARLKYITSHYIKIVCWYKINNIKIHPARLLHNTTNADQLRPICLYMDIKQFMKNVALKIMQTVTLWFAHLYLWRNLQSMLDQGFLQVIRLSRIPGWMSTSSGARWWGSSKSERERESGRERMREGGMGNREAGTAACSHPTFYSSVKPIVWRRPWRLRHCVRLGAQTPPPLCHLQQIQVALWSRWPQIITFNSFNSCVAAPLEGDRDSWDWTAF